MRVNWSGDRWVVYDIETGIQLANVRQLFVRVPSQLFSEELPDKKGIWHGWLIVSGNLRVEGDIGFIE